MNEVVLGSTSKVKEKAVAAALEALGIAAKLTCVKAHSLIAEQPFDDETISGAKNRAADAAAQVPAANLAVAIESGIFRRDGRYFDIAMVVVRLPSGEFIQGESEPLEFPADAVAETLHRGAMHWTCGRVLQDWGRVEKHDDPHLSLAGKSRSEFITAAVTRVFAELQERGLI